MKNTLKFEQRVDSSFGIGTESFNSLPKKDQYRKKDLSKAYQRIMTRHKKLFEALAK